MTHWNDEEIDFLTKNFANNSDKYLAEKLNRSLKSISYMACKLNFKKSSNYKSKINKKLNFQITKKLLEKLYINEGKSFGTIANELKIGKTTIEYYLKKFQIPRRNNTELLKKRNSEIQVWSKGLTKKDERIKKISIGIKRYYRNKRKERIKLIEEKFKKTIYDLLCELYLEKEYSLEKIGSIVGFNRIIISELIDFYQIPKRKKYDKINSLKGRNHSQFGKSWEEVRGRDKANKDKLNLSKIAKENILKRISNNEIPFKDTKIELLMEKELIKRNILFEKQFIVDKKFVCDFAIPNFKIIIECDGDYWHGNPKIYAENKLNETQKKKINFDKYKNMYLNSKGWKVFRFYETDILRNVENCVEQILKKIKSPLD